MILWFEPSVLQQPARAGHWAPSAAFTPSDQGAKGKAYAVPWIYRNLGQRRESQVWSQDTISLRKASVSHSHTWCLSFLSTSWNIFSSLEKSCLPFSQLESANGFLNLRTSFTAAITLEQGTLSDVQVSFIKKDLWFYPLDLQMGFIVIYVCVMKDHI